MPLTSAERSLRGQIAAHESWARTPDRTARTAPARRALLSKFEQEVLAEAVESGELANGGASLPDAELARRAENKRKAYFQRLALKSAQARRRRNEGRAR